MANSTAVGAPVPQRDRVPVSPLDLRQIEKALYQSHTSRFSTAQRLFFEALLADPELDAGAAARRVGLKPSKARRWLDSPAVQTALNHLADQRLKRLGIDKDRVLVKIVDLLDMAIGTAKVKKAAYDKDLGGFVQQEVYETDLAAAARFTDQLGKHLKLFQPEGLSGMQVNLSLNLGAESSVSRVEVSGLPVEPELPDWDEEDDSLEADYIEVPDDGSSGDD